MCTSIRRTISETISLKERSALESQPRDNASDDIFCLLFGRQRENFTKRPVPLVAGPGAKDEDVEEESRRPFVRRNDHQTMSSLVASTQRAQISSPK